jgi:hypothetical protein
LVEVVDHIIQEALQLYPLEVLVGEDGMAAPCPAADLESLGKVIQALQVLVFTALLVVGVPVRLEV